MKTEVDNFLIEKISEKLATNTYPATLPGQRKLFADCRKDKALKDYTFKNDELVGTQCFGELCMRATYQHTLKEEFNSYYGLTLGYPYFKKPLKPNKKDIIIKELKKIIQNHEIPVYVPCLKSKELAQKQHQKQESDRLIAIADKKSAAKVSFENIFVLLLFFGLPGFIFYYSFFTDDPGTTTETSRKESIAYDSCIERTKSQLSRSCAVDPVFTYCSLMYDSYEIVGSGCTSRVKSMGGRSKQIEFCESEVLRDVRQMCDIEVYGCAVVTGDINCN